MDTHVACSRGLSPVLGTALLVVILVLLVSLTGAAIFGLAERTDDAPEVAMHLEQTGDTTYTLVHRGGDRLAGRQVTVLGVADRDTLHGQQLTVEDRVEVVPVVDEVTLIWKGNNTNHTLHTFDVDSGSLPFDLEETDRRCPTAETNIEANGDLDLSDETVECHVYAATDDLTCSGTTAIGSGEQPCARYSPRGSDDY